MALDEPRADSVAAAKVDVWWRANADRVRAYVHHQVDPDDVDDIVQEVFVQALRRWDVVPEPPIGWLLKTARHVVANHRRGGRRFAGLLGRAAEVELRRPATDATAAERAASDELTALLTGVSARDREVLMLTAWYGLTDPEAAQVLGLTTNAYAVRLHRARTRLARQQPTDGGEES